MDWQPDDFLNGKMKGSCKVTNNAIAMTTMCGALTTLQVLMLFFKERCTGIFKAEQLL